MGETPRGFVYALPPVDNFDSAGWRVADELGDQSAAVQRARERIAEHKFWEGDDEIARGPFVMRLPMPDYHGELWVVAIKVANNGTTFVWSPVELPHLREWA